MTVRFGAIVGVVGPNRPPAAACVAGGRFGGDPCRVEPLSCWLKGPTVAAQFGAAVACAGPGRPLAGAVDFAVAGNDGCSDCPEAPVDVQGVLAAILACEAANGARGTNAPKDG